MHTTLFCLYAIPHTTLLIRCAYCLFVASSFFFSLGFALFVITTHTICCHLISYSFNKRWRAKRTSVSCVRRVLKIKEKNTEIKKKATTTRSLCEATKQPLYDDDQCSSLSCNFFSSSVCFFIVAGGLLVLLVHVVLL